MAASDETPRFRHAEKGMARFPPNIEQISIEANAHGAVLEMRRNDIVLAFALADADRRHLAALLLCGLADEEAGA